MIVACFPFDARIAGGCAELAIDDGMLAR